MSDAPEAVLLRGTPQPLPADWCAPKALPRPPGFHAETLAFELGLKQVLRVEDLPVSALETRLRPFREQGLAVAASPLAYSREVRGPNWRHGDPTCEEFTYAFLARQPDAAARANELDQAEKAGGRAGVEQRTRATLELGDLLGYPPCCTRRFLELDNQGDNRQWPAAIALHSSGCLPFVMNNLQYAENLLYFFPCSYNCPRAVGIMTTLFEGLRLRHPEFAEGLRRALGQVVLYAGWELFFLFEGKLTGDRLNYTGVTHPGQYRPDLAHGAEHRGAPLLGALLAGDELTLEGDQLEIRRNGAVSWVYRLRPPGVWQWLDFSGGLCAGEKPR
jgi:hypothetical protein